ncbi:amidohydrolase family protein [Muricoccus radiodurans]|uniref:amidohydrolase family protein n=1 Tax=Muricoccus radiodurans TaxID=2231721 RepID=UPI003CF9C3C9
MSETAPVRIVDCHHHVYQASRPIYPGGTPHPDATLLDYDAVRARVGITHHVLVQPSAYGFDNALHLEALRGREGFARLVAVVPPDLGAAEAGRLRAAGVVGVRANLVQGIPLAPSDVPALGRLCADQGWHLQVFANAEMVAGMAGVLRALPCPLVLDHYALLPPEGYQRHAAWPVVAGLLAAGRAWVKLSSPYALSPGEIGPLTHALATEGPGQLVWGTNWPHPNAKGVPQDEAALMAGALLPLPASLRPAVLWDNPARLYGFAS